MIRKLALTVTVLLLVVFWATYTTEAQRFNDQQTVQQPSNTVLGYLNTRIGSDNDRLKVSTYPGALPTLRAVSASAAINTQTTLTIPTPLPGLFNYVCSLSFTASQDATATAIAQAVTTNTNFGSWALQFSAEDVAHKVYVQTMYWGDPVTGCVKSDKPSLATTFISPAAVANASFAWQATYYQAP